MNVRISNKIYKRANIKLDSCRKQRDKRTYFEQIEEEPNILTGLEKRIFVDRQKRHCEFMDLIIAELKAEGKW